MIHTVQAFGVVHEAEVYVFLELSYIKTVYYHPAYLTYMQSTTCEMPVWMKHSWNQGNWEKHQ